MEGLLVSAVQEHDPQRLEHAVYRECKPFQLTRGLVLGIQKSPSGERAHKAKARRGMWVPENTLRQHSNK